MARTKQLSWVAALVALLALIAVAAYDSDGDRRTGGQTATISTVPVVSSDLVITDVHELLTVTKRGYSGMFYITYDVHTLVPDHPDQYKVVFRSAEYWTDPGFKADRVQISLETSPGSYVQVANWGGDGNPQNTVLVTFTTGSQGSYWVNDDDSPAWRLRVTGFEGSTSDTGYDYGVVW